MSGMDDFATGLVDEVLSDMAEHFFGSRKHLDDLIQRFSDLATELRGVQRKVAASGQRLAALLPGEEGQAALLRAVGVEAEVLVPNIPVFTPAGAAERAEERAHEDAAATVAPEAAPDLTQDLGEEAALEPAPDEALEPAPKISLETPLVEASAVGARLPAVQEGLPWALTRKGRYVKLVLQRYAAYQAKIDIYMNGQHQPHPENSKRRVLSLHYSQLRRFADRINENIAKLGEELSASSVIRIAHEFVDPGLADRERITGGSALLPGGSSDLDRDLAFKPLDFEAYGLVAFPELPPLDQVRGPLRGFCARIYAQEKAFAVQALKAAHEAARQAEKAVEEGPNSD